MVLTDKKLTILGVLAGLLLVATIVVYSGILFRPAKDFTTGALLIQGLDPKTVSEITIDQGGESLGLKRTDKGFVVTQRQGYPVPAEKINSLFVNLDIRCETKVTESKDNHKELGVSADDKEATVVKLLDSSGKELAGVVVGGSASRGPGVYIRAIDSDTVYTTSKRVSFSVKPSDYVNTDLLKIAKEDVLEVSVTQKDSTYIAARDKEGAVVLQNLPKGKRAKQSDVDNLFDALSNLTFDDIALDASVAAAADTTFTCKTSKHATYILKLTQKDDKHYVKMSAVGPPKDIIEKSMMIRPDDSQAELDKKAAVLTANDKAREFNDRHANWVYEIASWSAGKLTKPVGDLIEDIPADDSPEKITASHILIGYKGSSRSEATRTKAEAQKLAEDVLTEAKAVGADFAALAAKHSDGPTGKAGGSLGEFDKKTMHENFTKGAWELKVGEISGVVETPFGFHVIKRTK
jgi:parvulin-like peptidyl-prolyl isomerase